MSTNNLDQKHAASGQDTQVFVASADLRDVFDEMLAHIEALSDGPSGQETLEARAALPRYRSVFDGIRRAAESPSPVHFESAWRAKYGMPDNVPFAEFKDGRYAAPAVDDAWVGYQLAVPVPSVEAEGAAQVPTIDTPPFRERLRALGATFAPRDVGYQYFIAQIDQHVRNCIAASRGAAGQGALPVAKVGYVPGHYENGLDVQIIDPSKVHDGMMLYAESQPSQATAVPADARSQFESKWGAKYAHRLGLTRFHRHEDGEYANVAVRDGWNGFLLAGAGSAVNVDNPTPNHERSSCAGEDDLPVAYARPDEIKHMAARPEGGFVMVYPSQAEGLVGLRLSTQTQSAS